MQIGIDGDNFVYRFGFRAEEKTDDGSRAVVCDLDEVYSWIDREITFICNTLGVKKYTVYIDGDNNFRESIATIWPYKGNRDRGQRPLLYQTIKDYLLSEYKAVTVDGQEVDDQLGIDSFKDDSYIICTIDKDLKMIPRMNYNWVRNILLEINDEQAYRFFCMQLLEGDASDNIPSLYHQVEILHGTDVAKKLSKSRYKFNANKVLTAMTNYSDMFEYVKDMYKTWDVPQDYLIEVGKLLWIRREENEIWSPPC